MCICNCNLTFDIFIPFELHSFIKLTILGNSGCGKSYGTARIIQSIFQTEGFLPYKATFPNLWAISVAGHVDSGETSLDTAIRELKEEVNLDVDPNELEFLFTIKRETPYKDSFLRVFDDVYLLRKNIDCEQTKLQVEELTDIKYVYYEYLEDIFKEGDKDYVPYTEEHKKLFEILKDRNMEVI